MKKLYIFVTTLLIGTSSIAQSTVGFESHGLGIDSFDNGSALGGDFIFSENGSSAISLTNVYDTSWASWSGFAISTMTDVSTPGWMNQYSAFTGVGHDSSSHYAVFYYDGEITGQAPTDVISSFEITNTTYAALSMRDGDGVGKQFGSTMDANGMPDGTNGEDFFRLWIICESSWGDKDSIEFYLADYRFADSTQDYIIDEWTHVDVSNSVLGFPVNSMRFRLESSDNGQWGMNTPAYFAIDDIQAAPLVGIDVFSKLNVSVYPNPSSGLVNVEGEYGDLIVKSITGQVIHNSVHNALTTLDMSQFSSGIYVIQLTNASGSYTNRLIIQ